MPLRTDHFDSGLGVCNFVEDNILLTLVNYMPLGTGHFDSRLGVRNLTQTHQIAARRGGGIHTGALAAG